MAGGQARRAPPDLPARVENQPFGRAACHGPRADRDGEPVTRLMNGWPLFAVGAVIINAFMIAALLRFDSGSPGGVSQLIAYSVRWAVPFIFMVTAASSHGSGVGAGGSGKKTIVG